MAIGFRNAQTARLASTATTLAITKPTGTVQNDLLVMIGGNTGPQTMTMTGGTTWNKLKDVSAGGDAEGALWWKIAGGSEPSTYTLGQAVGQAMFGIVAAYTGASGVRDNQSAVTTTGSTTGPTPTALTGITATDLVIQAMVVGADTSGQATTTVNYPNVTTYPGWNQRAKLDIANTTGATWPGGAGLIDQIGSTAQPVYTVASLARQWVALSIALIATPSVRGGDFLPFFGPAHHDDELATRRASGLYAPRARELCRAA